MTKFKNFKEAFDMGIGSCRRICNCGREFYDSYNNWGWEEGEYEKLENDQTATAIDGAIACIGFESKEYVPECDCWHDRAKHIIGFIDTHAHEIAKYLSLEKERKTKEAESAPIVK